MKFGVLCYFNDKLNVCVSGWAFRVLWRETKKMLTAKWTKSGVGMCLNWYRLAQHPPDRLRKHAQTHAHTKKEIYTDKMLIWSGRVLQNSSHRCAGPVRLMQCVFVESSGWVLCNIMTDRKTDSHTDGVWGTSGPHNPFCLVSCCCQAFVDVTHLHFQHLCDTVTHWHVCWLSRRGLHKVPGQRTALTL